jgi:methylmalonyl-CoA/ethylmalonyl-CoA epimerase
MWKDWQFDHVGLVVNDLEKTLDYYRTMGMVNEEPREMSKDKYKTGFLRRNDVVLEFCQPGAANSIQSEFMKNHGEGINHMCFLVNDLEKETADLMARGIPVIEKSQYPAAPHYSETVLFDTRHGGTILLELGQMPSGEKKAASGAAANTDWQFDHLAFVVNNVRESLSFYLSLGFEVQLRARVPKGIPLAVFCRKGPVTLMFHGNNDWVQGKQFFEAHGEGVDHIAFNVNNIEEESAGLVRRGFPLKGKINPTADAVRAFYNTRTYGGVLLELAQPILSLWW